MKTLDLITTAIGNAFRAKTRTLLTVLAIFIGAFTLTLTNGLGTGINAYIDDTLASFGSSDAMTVTKHVEMSTGPQEYDPDAASVAMGAPGTTVRTLTQDDLDEIADIDGVTDATAVLSPSVTYVQVGDGTKYAASVASLVQGQTLTVAAGETPSGDANEVAIPSDFVDALGFADADAAIGETLTLSAAEASGAHQSVEATISGVTESTFSLGSSGALVTNAALTDAVVAINQTGLEADQQDRFVQAQVTLASGADVDAVKAALTDAGYAATTVEDMLGAFTTVIDGIVLVLNAFAIIALLAASFGIINTLFMSVQERTREIGLMKAMGMGSGRVFGLFSLEAVVIGFLGSAIGVGVAMLAGAGISSVLSDTLLADLPGLQLIAFDPVSIITVILAVMLIAFLAGTMPAAKAARKDPVEALRHE